MHIGRGKSLSKSFNVVAYDGDHFSYHLNALITKDRLLLAEIVRSIVPIHLSLLNDANL